MEQLGEQVFFDPFAQEDGQEQFDAQASFEVIFERYANDEIEHDYTADQFVADTEALLLDAQFTEQFKVMEMIAARMHELCGEDHLLQEAASQSILLGRDREDEHAMHRHDSNDNTPGSANKTAKAKAAKEIKKDKKKQLKRGWLQWLMGAAKF